MNSTNPKPMTEREAQNAGTEASDQQGETPELSGRNDPREIPALPSPGALALMARLLHKSEVNPNGCINWRGKVDSHGYGQIRIGSRLDGTRRMVYVHRLAAAMWKGFDLDSPLLVLHECDNPPCWNPKHLFSGTHADNSEDMVAKGRSLNLQMEGERNGSAKLTLSQVMAIRAIIPTTENRLRMAAECRVSVGHINKILRHEKWSHI